MLTCEEMAQLQTIYRSARFRRKYTYDRNDLGARCREGQTEFALWSPLAKSARTVLYEDGECPEPITWVPMVRTRQGVWRCSVTGNLHGVYYEYEIDHGKGPVPAGDPYARACGCNSGRSMVVDLRKTDPEGWDLDRAPEKAAEDIIWETHIKEFSWDPSGGFPEVLRGTYLAFTCPDTTLHGDGIHKTGLGYLKDLGVTAVELMPMFDYGSVDEADPQAFNWGYDPVYYNIPEGSYATDPHHGEIRIRQCKQMIKALHDQGFRVIMDVVYNHTQSLDSPFHRTVPGYYYRHDREGHASNGSLCGNEIASERPMCANFICSSVLYWAEEYHIDGFRFDLMGLLDVRLMNRIQTALDRKYGPGEKLLFGEPWAGGPPSMEKGAVPANKQNIGQLHPKIAMFSDNTRDGIRGNIFFSAQPGFVGGACNLEHTILGALQGWSGRLPGVKAPSQIISYVSCHDNLTLYDKLLAANPENREVMAMYRLAAAIYLTCQGHLFLLSGEEFGRTKGGNDNSYNAPIALNRLDWALTEKNRDLVDYYRGLIALRKLSPGLCDKTTTDRILSHWTEPHVLGAYRDNSCHGRKGILCTIYNAGTTPVTHSLCPGTWQLCADGENSFLWQQDRFVSGSVTVPPVSAMILRKEE